MKVSRHPDMSYLSFFKRTVAAQIHFVGLLMAIVGLFYLLQIVSLKNESNHYYSCLVFGVTSMIVLGTSTFYHFLKDGFYISNKLELFLEDLDHFAIYLFIAGTYTPFFMNAVANPWRDVLLTLVWSLAFIGIVYTHVKLKLPQWAQNRFLYTGIFVALGWTLIFRIGEIINTLNLKALMLLLFGGLSYTLGAVVYATKKPKLYPGFFGFHELWHVAVVFGFLFHYFMILSFYI